jgi:hypothetical protein
MRWTLETKGGTLIDIVDEKYEIENSYYILKSKLQSLLDRCSELNIDTITKKSFKLLRYEKFIGKRKNPDA